MRLFPPILGLLILCCLARPADAQEQPARATFDSRGPEVFGLILKVAGLKPISTLDHLTKAPGATLFVVLGDLGCLAQVEWGDFLNRGGAMLLAQDGPDESRLKDSLRVHISAIDILQAKPHAYRGEEKCPLIYLESTLGPEHPLMRRITLGKGLATNGPSDIGREERSPLVALASFPKDCWRDQPASKSEPGYFMVGSPVKAAPSGRMLVLAGQGVFFNSMLLPDRNDNVNFQFATNCVNWLKEGPNGPRSRVLFVNNGVVVSSMGLPTSIKAKTPRLPGLPPIPAAILANRLLRHIEEEKLLQEILQENFGLNNILRALLLTASAGLLFYGSWRLARGMLRVDTTVPLLIEPIPPAELAATPLQLRQQALAQLDNYGEPAQALARQWFYQHARVSPIAWDEPGFRLPARNVKGSLWQRWRRNRQIGWLREVAQNGPSMNGRRFRKLNELIRQLDGAELRFR